MKPHEIPFELAEVEETARQFIALTSPYRVFTFSGALGAGKTTFISAVCKQLGVEDIVSSPTFSIMQEYHSVEAPVYHMDFYRLRSDEEAIQAGLEDPLFSEHICFVEWPENAPGIIPADAVHTDIVIEGITRRKLRIKLPE